MIIDLETLWEYVTEETDHAEKLLSEVCHTCEWKSLNGCEECEWICDNVKNVVHRSHYYNDEIEN